MGPTVETYMEIQRGELDEAQTIKVEISGDVTLGTPATYWDPADPAEVEDIKAVVVESYHPKFPEGSTIELTPEEIEKAELALIEKAEEASNDTGFEPPDPDYSEFEELD
jgi:hypothetical protein